MNPPADTRPRLLFRALDEAEHRDEVRDVFYAYWPSYRSWIARSGRTPSARRSREAYLGCMPEMEPVLEHQRDAFGTEAEVLRLLTLYAPPPMVRGCSQAVWIGDGDAALVRNYDHAPQLSDGLVLRANWGGTRTLAMTDCLVGALDGINEHGVAIALAFGGRPAHGDGFAASMLVRYALQVASTTDEAVDAMRRVPCAMTYTFLIIDAQAHHATVYAAPDRLPKIDHLPASTNHQGRIEWPRYAAFSKTAERLAHLRACLDANPSLHELQRALLEPPLHRTGYERGSGTLYTATYRTADRCLELHWPDARMAIGLEGDMPEPHLAVYDTS
ncbi:MAG: C45 family peptidase [Planctomycetota bacterium]